MAEIAKAEMIKHVLQSLAYHDFDLLNEGMVTIWKYDHADFGTKDQLSFAAEAQTEQHLLLHHGLPSDGGVAHDDWCLECTKQFLSKRLGEFGKVLFEASSKGTATEELSTKEGAIQLVFRVAERLGEIQNEKMRAATTAVRAREEFGKPNAEGLETLVQSWKDDKDRVTDFYADWIGHKFPDIVNRAEQLSAIPARANVPETVQRYFLEATRSYIFGQYIACLVVCRAAIELALGDFLVRNGKEAELRKLDAERRDSLSARIDLAQTLGKWNLKFTLGQANEVKYWAGQALHEKPVKAEKCKELFVKARGVLGDLYS